MVDRIRKTKIVCTLGPATSSEEMLKKLISAGMDVARLNMSHGTHEEHSARIKLLRKAADSVGKVIGILGDLQGPKIRLGDFPNGAVTLKQGQKFTLTSEEVQGSHERSSVTYPNLAAEVKEGETILLADGALELKVRERTKKDIICDVVIGGEINSHKGVNLPGSRLKISAITEKDKKDIAFAVREKLDYLAASFVRKAKDVKDARCVLEEHAASIPIISKIEKPEAVLNLEDILDVSDGIMIARGDLGVEIPLEKVPIVAKEIMARARRAGKPVITATQMLKSMVEASKPTRAETTDVANAVIDGTDAVMLSEETAVGKYPIEAVRIMGAIAIEAENASGLDFPLFVQESSRKMDIADAIAHAVFDASKEQEITAIVTPSARGTTPMRISRLRPDKPILMLTENQKVANRFALIWGVTPVCIKMPTDLTEIFNLAGELTRKKGFATGGDRIIVTAGFPIYGTPTNLIYIHKLERQA